MVGFNNALKGKLFEIKYLDHITETLEPGYTAKLADSPTQKGFDIEIYNQFGEIDQQLQLKASTSASIVQDALEQYPEIDVVTLKNKIDANEKFKIIDIRESEEVSICKINNTIQIGRAHV